MDRDFIHRDTKPDNFLISTRPLDYTLRIIDLGLGKRFQHPNTRAHSRFSEGHDFFVTMCFCKSEYPARIQFVFLIDLLSGS